MTKALIITTKGLILFSALSLLSVSFMAIFNPQTVMDLVNVKLPNNDASSSIRGVYGGIGLTLSITLIYLMLQAPIKGLILLSMLWGFYASSRIITIFTEGPLGQFGIQWLIIESALCLVALVLLIANRKIITE